MDSSYHCNIQKHFCIFMKSILEFYNFQVLQLPVATESSNIYKFLSDCDQKLVMELLFFTYSFVIKVYVNKICTYYINECHFWST